MIIDPSSSSSLTSSAPFLQLSFVAELPPLSLNVYHVIKAPAGSAPRARYVVHRHGDPPTVHSEHFQVSRLQGPEADLPLLLSNKHLQIWSAPETGLLQVWTFKVKARSNEKKKKQQNVWFCSGAEAAAAVRSGPTGPGTLPVVRNQNLRGPQRSVPVPARGGGSSGESGEHSYLFLSHGVSLSHGLSLSPPTDLLVL